MGREAEGLNIFRFSHSDSLMWEMRVLNYLPSITYTNDPTSPSVMIILSLLYSTGYMQSTISRICAPSRLRMKSLSSIASLMSFADLKQHRKTEVACILLLFFREAETLCSFVCSLWFQSIRTRNFSSSCQCFRFPLSEKELTSWCLFRIRTQRVCNFCLTYNAKRCHCLQL